MEDVVQDANDPDGREVGTVFMSDVVITHQRWYRYWLSSRRSRRSCRRTGEPITNIDRRIATAIPCAIEGRLAHRMTVIFAKQVRDSWKGGFNSAFARALSMTCKRRRLFANCRAWEMRKEIKKEKFV